MPFAAVPLDGSERFTGLDATVADFWRWAFSDLRDNTTRGILAEFLVARAVGDERDLRIGWDNFDAQAPDGTTIEVKCSAFLQSWALKRHSELRFGRLSAREFDATRNEYSVDARVRADVFVFCVQTQREPAAYDMLDISHWEFWVVDASTIRELGVKSIGIGWVRRHATGPLPYGELAEAIRVAARANSAPRLTGATAAAETKKRYQASLDEKLLGAGAEVMRLPSVCGSSVRKSVCPQSQLRTAFNSATGWVPWSCCTPPTGRLSSPWSSYGEPGARLRSVRCETLCTRSPASR
jgi:hypothetical protein